MKELRYHRQELFQKIGKAGQEKLKASSVLILGCGALGSFQANLLARAGIGHLVLVDRDVLEWSNLQRQVLYDERQVKEELPKAVAAKQRLEEINSDIEITAIVKDVNASSIEELIKDVDIILDATDNFTTRYLLNDACMKHEKPWIYGACVGSYGLSMSIIPGKTPCFQCLFEEPPDQSPTCDTVGVLNAIAGVVASLQTTEACKMLLGDFQSVRKGLLSIDLWDFQLQEVRVTERRKDCLCCGEKSWDYLHGKKGESAVVLCGRNTVQISHGEMKEYDLDEMEKRLKAYRVLQKNEYFLKIEIETKKITIFFDGRVFIEGCQDPSEGRQIYAKYITA